VRSDPKASDRIWPSSRECHKECSFTRLKTCHRPYALCISYPLKIPFSIFMTMLPHFQYLQKHVATCSVSLKRLPASLGAHTESDRISCGRTRSTKFGGHHNCQEQFWLLQLPTQRNVSSLKVAEILLFSLYCWMTLLLYRGCQLMIPSSL
jgi:hypothetical protein